MDYPFHPTTPEQCEAYCKKVAGCNAWASCAGRGPGGAPAGCGAGCLAWGAAHNPDKAGFIQGSCNSGECVASPGLYSSQCSCIANLTLPVEAVGTFGRAYPSEAGAYRGCMPKCEPPKKLSWKREADPWWGYTCGKCTAYAGCKDFTPSDQFAFGMCTLLSVRNPSKPAFLPGRLSAGWVSGIFDLPQDCYLLSYEACTKCQAAASTDKCRGCVRDLNLTLNQQLGTGSGILVHCRDVTWQKGVECSTLIGQHWEHQCGAITQKQLLDPSVNNCIVDAKRRYVCKPQVGGTQGLRVSHGATVSSAG
jgi:hypothetical protein